MFRHIGRSLALLPLLAALSWADEGDKDVRKDKEQATTPEECFDQFKTAVRKKDKDRFWDLLSRGSQKEVEKMGEMIKSTEGEERAEAAKHLGRTVDELDKMTARDVVIESLFADSNAERMAELAHMKIVNVSVDEDKAEGDRVDGEDAEHKERAYFIRENGEWKLDLQREMNGDGEDGGAEPEPMDGEDEEAPAEGGPGK